MTRDRVVLSMAVGSGGKASNKNLVGTSGGRDKISSTPTNTNTNIQTQQPRAIQEILY